MKTLIDLANWNRREHFAFFSRCDEPFHGIVANLDCRTARDHCRREQLSFFQFYLHQVLAAVNHTQALRLRIEDGQVLDYHSIHAHATISRPDHTFGFCRIAYQEEFAAFSRATSAATELVKQASGLCIGEHHERTDAIHFSAIPWISFSGISHARRHNDGDSVPKISVGKCYEQDGRLLLPVATFVHHGLVDGWHIHQFLERLENGLQDVA
ncbi:MULTISPECIES: CatA-like O-acetyltransferase [unclassified Undibacterium]|uniref:CatA-like O-acetyltransferase n=1 Tax=unclassified Undibacterium TaxID=2630295 RepID=UPI002AC89AFD|nr:MULTISPECIES: CatA-like O-acetyltransferase [unclassified Undibacterium]MEB0137738.1 CatA-like O-acetyltransferase [Undibacterium sp. CCC2.1]MEB0172820.1 CatA-like O-acetyltransferase [Undibacterium sp. CCC1.1]MEB0176706.1 CatA-like O-acetyltransferase [Undibacterium sp. CCC3.4]MEB0215968.1 CatA-like O-acetyltransferase [Undibacterium sp. 5I2]WPX42313.1 CatA-like O-acetyltransferase [Undibacterium sp. CCC3.4]